MVLINELIECDEFEDIATLKNIGELLNQNSSDLQQKLCQIGDSIVYKLVQWTRRLPFYSDLPVDVHTRLLTHKWHELLVLTTSAYQAIHGSRRMGTTRTDGEKVELHQEVATNLVTLQTCLTSMMGKPITMDQLRQDVGNMVEKITKVIAIFRQCRLMMEEYVCLKVIAMASQEGERGSLIFDLPHVSSIFFSSLLPRLSDACFAEHSHTVSKLPAVIHPEALSSGAEQGRGTSSQTARGE